MGAAAGHIKHLYEDLNLTFNDLNNIGNQIINNEYVLYEKFDGQNLMVTVINGVVYGARNKTQMKSPIPILQIPEMMIKYPHVHESFSYACKKLDFALKRLPETIQVKYFKNGEAFLNVELLNSKSINIINYGEPKIVCNSFNYKDNTSSLEEVLEFTSKCSKWLTSQDIHPPQVIKADIYQVQPNYLLSGFKSVGIDSTMTLGDYYSSIQPNFTKIPNTPVKFIITKFSSHILKNCCSNFYDESTKQYIKDKLTEALKFSKENDIVKTNLMPHVNTILACGNITEFPKLEGVVFYTPNQYKLTGIFAPLNQILGYIKYRL